MAGKHGRYGPPDGNTNGVTHWYYSLKARLSGADLDMSERTKIGAHIRENLKTLGLKRVSKEISLSDYLSEKYGDQDSSKSRSSVHVNKRAPDSPGSPLAKEKDSNARYVYLFERLTAVFGA